MAGKQAKLTDAQIDFIDARLARDGDLAARREAFYSALRAARALVPAGQDDLRGALFKVEDAAASWSILAGESGFLLGLEVADNPLFSAVLLGLVS